MIGNINSAIWRRKELGAARLVFLVAVIVAMGIMPPVCADTSPIAAPESASASCWIVGVIINALVSGMLIITAFLARRWRIAGQALAAIVGLAALVVGLLLLLPAFAFAAHGPALAGARAAMTIGAVGDFAAGVLAVTSAGMLPRFGSVVRQLVQDVRTHRRVGALFLMLWLALLAIAVAAWFGIVPGWNQMFLRCVLLPIPASILIGWWRSFTSVQADKNSIIDSLLGDSLIGALVMVPTQIVLVSFDAISTLLSGAASPLGWEGVELVVMFGIIGFVQGAVGALRGAGLAAIWRRLRQQGGPAASVRGS